MREANPAPAYFRAALLGGGAAVASVLGFPAVALVLAIVCLVALALAVLIHRGRAGVKR